MGMRIGITGEVWPSLGCIFEDGVFGIILHSF